MPTELSSIEDEYLEAIWRLERKIGMARDRSKAHNEVYIHPSYRENDK